MRKVIPAAVLFLAFSIPPHARAQTPLDENHVGISPGVIRVGRDIAYYGDDGKLQITDTTFQKIEKGNVAYRCETNRLNSYVGASLSEEWPLQLKHKGCLLKSRILGLGFYNSGTGSFRMVHPAKGLPPYLSINNKIKFNDIFPECELHCFYDEFGFKQQFLLKGRSPLSEKREKGDDFLAILTRIDLDSLPSYQASVFRNGGREFYQGSDLADVSPAEIKGVTSELKTGPTTTERRIKIALPDLSERRIAFTFQDDVALDTSADPVENHVHPEKILKTMDGKHCLLQLIPLSWLEKATLPVRVGLTVYGGSYRNQDEVFTAGNTYVVEGRCQVSSLSSIGQPDKPIAVKYLPGRNSRIAVLKDKGRGARVEHTVFTSIHDNHPGRGAVIDPAVCKLKSRMPAPGDYDMALYVSCGYGSYLKNSMIYYAHSGVTGNVHPGDQKVEAIENVLFEHCKRAAAELPQWPGFLNNTVRDCNEGVIITSPAEKGTVVNCVFADNKNRACSAIADDTSFNDVWYNNGKDTANDCFGKNALKQQDGLGNPFTTGAYGDCYLNQDAAGGARLINPVTPGINPYRGFRYPGN